MKGLLPTHYIEHKGKYSVPDKNCIFIKYIFPSTHGGLIYSKPVVSGKHIKNNCLVLIFTHYFT